VCVGGVFWVRGRGFSGMGGRLRYVAGVRGCPTGSAAPFPGASSLSCPSRLLGRAAHLQRALAAPGGGAAAAGAAATARVAAGAAGAARRRREPARQRARGGPGAKGREAPRAGPRARRRHRRRCRGIGPCPAAEEAAACGRRGRRPARLLVPLAWAGCRERAPRAAAPGGAAPAPAQRLQQARRGPLRARRERGARAAVRALRRGRRRQWARASVGSPGPRTCIAPSRRGRWGRDLLATPVEWSGAQKAALKSTETNAPARAGRLWSVGGGAGGGGGRWSAAPPRNRRARRRRAPPHRAAAAGPTARCGGARGTGGGGGRRLDAGRGARQDPGPRKRLEGRRPAWGRGRHAGARRRGGGGGRRMAHSTGGRPTRGAAGAGGAPGSGGTSNRHARPAGRADWRRAPRWPPRRRRRGPAAAVAYGQGVAARGGRKGAAGAVARRTLMHPRPAPPAPPPRADPRRAAPRAAAAPRPRPAGPKTARTSLPTLLQPPRALRGPRCAAARSPAETEQV
jgi:hypothetical protein